MNKTNSNSHLTAPFHRLTEADIKQHYKDNLINTTGYLFYIRRIICPPNKQFVIPNIVKFCEEWGIARPSFYRAVDHLKAKGYMTWEATHGLIFTDATKIVDFPTENETHPQERTESIEDGHGVSKTDTQYQNLDSDIYIDHARPDITDKTDNSDINPPTPQVGDVCEGSVECDSFPLQSEIPDLLPSKESDTQEKPENPSSGSIVPVGSFEQIEQWNKVTDEQKKEWFLQVYLAEKPSNFTNHESISFENLKKINKLCKEYPQEAIAKFRDALIWVREQKDGWWRDNNFSLGNLMSNGKISEYADKHATAMKHDPAYRDRVEGRAPSKDLKRIAPNANVSQAQYEEAYEAEKRKQELIDTYDYRPVIAKLRRF